MADPAPIIVAATAAPPGPKCAACGVALPDDGKLRVKVRPRKCHACRLLMRKGYRQQRGSTLGGIRERLLCSLRHYGIRNVDWVSTAFIERVLAAWNNTCAISGQTRTANQLDLVPYRGFKDLAQRQEPLPEREWVVVTRANKVSLNKSHLQPEQRMSKWGAFVHNRMGQGPVGGGDDDDD